MRLFSTGPRPVENKRRLRQPIVTGQRQMRAQAFSSLLSLTPRCRACQPRLHAHRRLLGR